MFNLNTIQGLNPTNLLPNPNYKVPPPAPAETTEKKPRKRRTREETNKRDFVCGCGKSYVSYPAIYLHVQRKHEGQWPENTNLPQKPDIQDKVPRGRPKVIIISNFSFELER
jgi:hypothetical protein